MAWHSAYDRIKPHLFRIDTENGFGTGFLYAYNVDHSIVAIATAAHVVQVEHSWSKPIRIGHFESKDIRLVNEQDRVIWVDHRRDSASIIIAANMFKLPSAALPHMDHTKYKKVGVELGWVGFPAICAHELCFFSGRISTYRMNDSCYLIDGVAINGVSGGPVFNQLADSTPEIVGIVSAYMPNVRPQDTLPGLLRAQDITPFNEHVQKIKDFDDAKAKEKETQQEVDKSQADQAPCPQPPDTGGGEPTK